VVWEDKGQKGEDKGREDVPYRVNWKLEGVRDRNLDSRRVLARGERWWVGGQRGGK